MAPCPPASTRLNPPPPPLLPRMTHPAPPTVTLILVALRLAFPHLVRELARAGLGRLLRVAGLDHAVLVQTRKVGVARRPAFRALLARRGGGLGRRGCRCRRAKAEHFGVEVMWRRVKDEG